MDNRQYAGDSAYSVEAIRAHEVRCLVGKLSLSPEQREAIENLSRSLVEELVHGPMAKMIAFVQEAERIGGYQRDVAKSKRTMK
jgi:predicted Zn-dependent protease